MRSYLIANNLDALGAARNYIQSQQTGQVGSQAQPASSSAMLAKTTVIVAPADDPDYWHHSALTDMGPDDEAPRQGAHTMHDRADSGVQDGIVTQNSVGTQTVGGTQPLLTTQPVLATQPTIWTQAVVATPPIAENQVGAETQHSEGGAEWNVLDRPYDGYGEDPIDKMSVG